MKNNRATRIWLGMILKKHIGKIAERQIARKDLYLQAMGEALSMTWIYGCCFNPP